MPNLSALRPAITRTLTAALTSNARRSLVRTVKGLGRRLSGQVPTVEYFHQVDDPYSHLIAQLLTPLARRYGVRVRPWLVSPPEDSATPERELLKAYALRDAPLVAVEYGLSFPAAAARPDAGAIDQATRVLAATLASDDFPDRAVAVGSALWRGDAATVAAHSPVDATAALAAGDAERRRRGHYFSAMLYFEGEWYWGVDRLNHLEQRLQDLGFDRQPHTAALAPYRDLTLGEVPKGGKPPVIEAWYSFRSPYSWIAMPRLRRLAHHYGAELRLRPILPMIMRGLPVPTMKSLYIMLDTKREAERVGIPYGRMVDPYGAGIERSLAAQFHAIRLGLGEAFAEAGLRAVFAEGIDLADDAGLYEVARRAGLTDAQTAAALADDSWRAPAEANRQALLEAGLWGAPTYRVNGGPAHWGQDRLWALEHDLVAAMRPVLAASGRTGAAST